MEEKQNKRGAGGIFKLLMVMVVIALGVMVMKYLKTHGPTAEKVEVPQVLPVVRVVVAQASTHRMKVATQGRVRPSRKTQAASELKGRVIRVDPRFKVGGQFKEGEVMLEIDGSDYVAALASAKAALADAQLVLAQEKARAQQARRDWAKLGRGEPSELVLRIPQITRAQARVAAAKATVAKAERDLERTKLRAPYACRLEAVYTDLGSYVLPGARLADVYSVGSFEVRVPITLEEMGYLPKQVIGVQASASAEIGNVNYKWQGKVIRREGLVDQSTMTMYLVVKIAPNQSIYPFPPSGLFVEVLLDGKQLEHVTEIPRSALRSDHTLLTVNAENKLHILPVKVLRTLPKSVLISEGLRDGTRVIVSPMETPLEGMSLKVEEVK